MHSLQEFGRVESSVTTKIKGVTRSHLDDDSEDDPGEKAINVVASCAMQERRRREKEQS